LFYPINDKKRLEYLFENDFKNNKISKEEKDGKISLVRKICEYAVDQQNCR
jgi:hypothetical protein